MAEWVKRRNVWVSKEPVSPGIWKRRDGGYQVRARATDEATGRERDVVKNLPKASLGEAEAALARELERARSGGSSASDPSRLKFKEYATRLFERKVLAGDLKSSQSVQKWSGALARELIPYFGEHYLARLKATHAEAWKVDVLRRPRPPRRLKNGKLGKPLPPPKPTSVNTWLDVLKAIMRAAAAEFEWPRDPLASVKPLDTSDHRTYTEEQPNSLEPAEARRFLAKMAEMFPQHLAMTALGFATGLRPSSMRPLRRSGPTPDVLWSQGIVLVRRSQTKGEPLEKTKTARDQRIHLPEEVMRLLAWHVGRLPPGDAQTSELLFPSASGGFRSRSCLDKPFAAVCKAIGLKKRLTPRGMRRTYQDLMRAAQVEGVVVRAISGHATSQMQEHYSTVSPTEMRAAVLRLAAATGFDDALAIAARVGHPGSELTTVAAPCSCS
ncbi:MAG TPA: tyrosine-type recombinase/integrase [Polyangiaceae bacterium]|nr:tyrosine-type recombinase/integrase [Polyangiaceae bacterium]